MNNQFLNCKCDWVIAECSELHAIGNVVGKPSFDLLLRPAPEPLRNLKNYKSSNFNVYITNLQISSNLLQQIVWHFNVYFDLPETLHNLDKYKFTKCRIPQIVWNCNVYIHPPEPLRNLQIQKYVFHKLFEILKLGKGFISSNAGGR